MENLSWGMTGARRRGRDHLEEHQRGTCSQLSHRFTCTEVNQGEDVQLYCGSYHKKFAFHPLHPANLLNPCTCLFKYIFSWVFFFFFFFACVFFSNRCISECSIAVKKELWGLLYHWLKETLTCNNYLYGWSWKGGIEERKLRVAEKISYFSPRRRLCSCHCQGAMSWLTTGPLGCGKVRWPVDWIQAALCFCK